VGSQEWGQKRVEQSAVLPLTGKVTSPGRAEVHAFKLQGSTEVLRGCLICAKGAPEQFLGITVKNNVWKLKNYIIPWALLQNTSISRHSLN